MTSPMLPERLRDAGLSAWELGDLLGIHPHLVSGPHPLVLDRAVQVLIELARRLDIHPADLVPELEPLLSRPPPGPRRRRRRPGPASRCPHRADRARHRPGPAHRRPAHPRPGMAAAAHHSRHRRRPGQPGLGGPLALRRIPPGTWTVTHRLDIPTQAQRRALRHLTGAAIVDDDQARVLLAALAAGQSGTYADLQAQPGWAAAETELKETGLIYGINGPDEVHVGDDVKFSLRYSDNDHIARELGEPPPLDQATTYPARGAEARAGARE